MGREALVSLGVVVLVVLAGCEGPAAASVAPNGSVERVRGTGDDRSYRMRLAADANYAYSGATFGDLTVTGYAANGTPLCRADVGQASTGEWLFDDSATAATVTCGALPAVLFVTNVRFEPSETPTGGVRLSLPMAVYVGRGNATELFGLSIRPAPYRYERGPARTYRVDRTVYSVRPTAEMFRYAKCRQYAADANFSALPGDHPWTRGDPRPPESTEWYSVTVSSSDRSDRPDYRNRSLSSLPPVVSDLVREALPEATEEYVERTTNVSESTFYDAHATLLGREVRSLADLPTENGEWYLAGRADDRRLDCTSRTYTGEATHWVDYAVNVNGRIWEVTLSAHADWDGTVDVPTVDESPDGHPGGEANGTTG